MYMLLHCIVLYYYSISYYIILHHVSISLDVYIYIYIYIYIHICVYM